MSQDLYVFTWQTKDGKRMLMSEMTDEHIANAIPYSKKRGKAGERSLELLHYEVKRRKHEAWVNEVKDCPHCKSGTMERIRYESDPDVGWTDTNWYQFTCVKCEARGPKENMPHAIRLLVTPVIYGPRRYPGPSDENWIEWQEEMSDSHDVNDFH